MEHQNHVQGVQLITRVLGLVLVLFFRFLLICQLEDLDLTITLKEFFALTQNTARDSLSNQVSSVLRAMYKALVPKIFKCFSTIKIPSIFGIDFLIIFCLTKSPSLNNIVFLKRYYQKILS